MRVTFLLPTVGMSGGIRVPVIHARWLMDQGHKVVLISPPAQRQSFRSKISSFLKTGAWPRYVKNPKSYLDGSGLDHRVLESYRAPRDEDVPDADVLICTWWETAEWASRLSASKGARVYFIQGYEIFPYLPIDRVHATYRLPMHKIVVAAWLKKVMAESYGDNLCDVVPNSIDRNQFFAPVRSKQAVPTIGFLYSESSVKGVDTALEVIKRLKEKVPGLRVVSFGSQPPVLYKEKMEGIDFYLAPAQHSIREIYAQCDCWLATSRSEGFNLTAMEAMACRTPVVSTKTGWPEEVIVDGYNGYLADIGNVEELVDFVVDILYLDTHDWERMSKNTFQTVENSTWEQSSVLFEKSIFNAAGILKNELAGASSSEIGKH